MAATLQHGREAKQVFSYHLIPAPLLGSLARLISSRRLKHVPGLRHSEFLLPMKMGHPVTSPGRYRWGALAFLGFWESEAAMLNMVGGEHAESGRGQHQSAMIERARKPFHYEFTTMRFVPISTHGQWPWPESPLEGARR